MNRNGRSGKYFITTTSQSREALWERLFGADRLPVVHDHPRWQQMPGRGSLLAYDLDLRALHPAARRRLAAYVYWRVRRRYVDVMMEVETAVSWPVDACDCTVVSDEETAVLFFGVIWPGLQNGRVII